MLAIGAVYCKVVTTHRSLLCFAMELGLARHMLSARCQSKACTDLMLIA